jgi:hypothetical protein
MLVGGGSFNDTHSNSVKLCQGVIGYRRFEASALSRNVGNQITNVAALRTIRTDISPTRHASLQLAEYSHVYT